MPVTAKLSRKFYEALGDDVANELVDWFNAVDATYRSDLRDLNELNFARFDAKLEQRAAELDAKIDRRATELEAKIDRRTAELDAKIDQRAAELDAKIEQRATALDAKIEQRTAELDAKIEQRTAELRVEIHDMRASLIRWMFGFWTATTLTMAGLAFAVVQLVRP